jgi:putative aldouronate transport system permease protein
VGWLVELEYIFSLPGFWDAFRNTLILNLYSLVLGFPAPIILALLLNEMRGQVFKRITQTIIYMPHFFSWVIVGGLFLGLLSPGYGAVNILLQKLGYESIYFAADPAYIRAIIVGTGIWKGAGWGTIVYLATLTGLIRRFTMRRRWTALTAGISCGTSRSPP